MALAQRFVDSPHAQLALLVLLSATVVGIVARMVPAMIRRDPAKRELHGPIRNALIGAPALAEGPSALFVATKILFASVLPDLALMAVDVHLSSRETVAP